jgi:protein-L-isoaspartate O-methyltransferase
VLEVGTGTGKATRGLIERGWSVVALEPGRELAAVARRVLAGRGDVDLVVSPFERWEPGDQTPFDLVFAARDDQPPGPLRGMVPRCEHSAAEADGAILSRGDGN